MTTSRPDVAERARPATVRAAVGRPGAFEVLVAGLAAFGVGLRIGLPASLTPAVIVAALLFPVWVWRLASWQWARTLGVLSLAALFNGGLLALVATARHWVEPTKSLALGLLILSIFAGAGVLLWARMVIGLVPVVVLFALASIVTVSRANVGVILNPWKFGYSIPVTILVLALVWSQRKLWLELAALAALAAVGMLNDSRSYFAMLLVAAVVICWQRVSQALSGRSLVFSSVGLVAAAGFVYVLATRLASSGVLGEAAALRTQAQMENSDSLLVGGRPELAATWALMRDRPWGFGLGRMPSLRDLRVAKGGMAESGYDPNNGYVERYMFGSGFEVHSLFGDFWIHLGVVGLVLILCVALVAVVSVARQIAAGTVSALAVFLTVNLLWNIAFSPLYSSIPATTIALLVLLRPRHESSPMADDESVQSSTAMTAAA